MMKVIDLQRLFIKRDKILDSIKRQAPASGTRHHQTAGGSLLSLLKRRSRCRSVEKTAASGRNPEAECSISNAQHSILNYFRRLWRSDLVISYDRETGKSRIFWRVVR